MVVPAERASSTTTLGQTAARGGLISLGGQAVRALLQVTSLVVLARILSPADYGLMAMVAVLVGVAEVFRDFGLSSAAVQAPALSRLQRDNLFWVNTGIGLLLALVFTAAAPLVAAAFGETALTDLTRAMAWVFLLNGLATQFRAGLTRRLAFSRLALADVAGPLVGLLLAVPLALGGAGVWALAVQQLTAAAVMLVLVACFGGWVPGRPRRGASVVPFLRYGGGLVGSQLVGYAANNADTLVIGLRFSPSALGLYTRAFQLLMVPLSQARAPLTQVALPTLARLQEDRIRFQSHVNQAQLALGYSFVVALGLVVGAAGPVVAVFLGERWLDVEPLLALIAVAACFQMLAFVGFWVYLALGLTDVLFRYTLVEATVKVVCIIVGSLGGVVGVAAGYALAPAISWPISLWWLSRKTGLRLRPLYLGALRILAVTALVATVARACVALVASLGGAPWLQLAVSVVVAVSAYVATVAVVPTVRTDVLPLYRLARSQVRRSARRDA